MGKNRTIRRVAVAAAGGATVATGLVLVPLPGPGWLIVGGGLAILGTEFPAARRLLDGAKERVRSFLAGEPADREVEGDEEAASG